MKTFAYYPPFSPYQNTLKAKNLKDARKEMAKRWPEYNTKNWNICYK